MFGKWNIKLLSYSPQSNEKTNVERNEGCIIYKFGFTQNLCGGTILTSKGKNKKLSFLKESEFVWSEYNLFHMRNGKKGNPTWNISKCGGI